MAIGIDGFLEERIESLFVCDEYKLFFLTGQKNGTGRRAYITAKAFHTFNEDALDQMRAKAKPSAESRVQISSSQGALAFRDMHTGTVSNVPWAELDQDVQDKLRGVISNPFAKYAAATTTDVKVISPGEPVILMPKKLKLEL